MSKCAESADAQANGYHTLLPPAAQLALVEAAARARQLKGLERAAVVEDAIRYVRTNWPECFRWK